MIDCSSAGIAWIVPGLRDPELSESDFNGVLGFRAWGQKPQRLPKPLELRSMPSIPNRKP